MLRRDARVPLRGGSVAPVFEPPIQPEERKIA